MKNAEEIYKDLNQIVEPIHAHSDQMLAIAHYIENELKKSESNQQGLLNFAVEFGYKQCEKGHNIQRAISEFNKVR